MTRAGKRRAFHLPASHRRLQNVVDEELQFHLDGRIDELIAKGMTREQAEAEARRRFGDMDIYGREAAAIDERILQEQRRMDILDTLSRELRLGARSLLRSRGFAATAILTLALGLGATTAIFTVLDAVVLRPLPYRDADQLMEVTSPVSKFKGDTLWRLARHEMFYFKDNARTLSDIGVYQSGEVTVLGEEVSGKPAERALDAHVSASLFDVLGFRPLKGRLFTPDDNHVRQATVVILGERYWQRRFGSDETILNRVIQIDGYPMTVVGILPASAQLPDEIVDIWTPAHVDPAMPPMNNHTWSAIARLKPSTTAAEAQTELTALTSHLSELFPNGESASFVENTGFHTQVRPLRAVVVGDVMTRALWIIFGSVLFVLLIAGANLSNLFLVRIDARRREMALRTALGAERFHVAMQFLAEGTIIAVLAAFLAVVLAQIGLRLLVVAAPSGLPRLSEIHLTASGIGFAIGGALVAAFILGMLPLAGGSALDIALLREGGRGLTTSRGRQIVRGALVISQVALSLVLLTASGLMVRSFNNLRAVKPGFDPAGVVTMHVALPEATYGKSYERTSTFYEQLAERIGHLPGVKAVGFSEKIPLASSNLCTGVMIEALAIGDCPPTSIISPGYVEAMGIKVNGRPLAWSGMNARSGDMMVSQAFSDRIWPTQSAMDKGVRLMGKGFFHVSGVAADVLANGFDQPPVALVYFPMLPTADSFLYGVPTYTNMVVKTVSGDPLKLTPAIGKLVSELEPQAAIANVQTMDALVAKSMSKRSLTMMLLGIAAAMALFLSVVGLYGVISYIVAQRQSEIAIRMALGAQMAQVGRMVVGQSMLLAGIGVVIGLVAAFATTRVMTSLLFGVSPADPVLMSLAALVLLLVSALAGYGPARRAARVNPADAFRTT
ncbi:MAG: permease [Gemmatimonadetes bacterium]|nr:permease [Gemmatimonadota bacterium]